MSFIVKMVLCGDQGVGKTSLIRRYVDNDYSSNTAPSMGVNFTISTYEGDTAVYQVHGWDISGHPRHTQLAAMYARDAQIILLVFDLCSRASFDAIDLTWFPLVRHVQANYYLVGTKLDMADEARRQVPNQQALFYANCNGMRYFEVSAKTGQEVKHNFEGMLAVATLPTSPRSTAAEGSPPAAASADEDIRKLLTPSSDSSPPVTPRLRWWQRRWRCF